jgi:multidrug resistance efflux pump
MNIRHERPMPDMAFRMQAPLGLSLPDGQRAAVREWSLTGLTSYDLPDEPLVEAILSIPFQGVVLSFPVTLEKDPGQPIYRFRNLTGRQRETLSLFYRSLLSGKMATTGDMITSLDTPVDLIPMEETEQEREIAVSTKTPRGFRTLMVLVVYMVLSLSVFGYLGSLVLHRINEITVQHARFIAPIEPVSAQVSGFVSDIIAEPGAYVAAGEPILQLSDPQAERRLEDLRRDKVSAEIALAEAMADLARHEAGRASERRKLQADLQAAIAERRPRDFLGGYDLDEVEDANRALMMFDNGLSAAPRDFNSIGAQYIALADDRRQRLRIIERDFETYRAALNNLTVIAPRNGRVATFFVSEGQYLRAGTDLLDFEEDRPRTVQGWLDHRYSGAVFEGMPSIVTFNLTGEKRALDARVVRVEAALDPARPNNYGIMVVLEADGISTEESRVLFSRNAPAAVSLVRNVFGLF